MELFATDCDRLALLLGTNAAPNLDFKSIEVRAGELVTVELPPDR